jgi:hypothetical protein
MVFGNTLNVRSLRETVRQEQIYAMRVPRSTPLSEIVRRTGLSEDEVKRFNPALVRQVPKGANLYLPYHVEELGPDVSFWHRPANPDYAVVLNDFLRTETSPAEWNSPAFQPVLREFQRRFRETGSEEGLVMAAVIGYAMQETGMNHRLLGEYRASPEIQRAFDRGVRARRTELQTVSGG